MSLRVPLLLLLAAICGCTSAFRERHNLRLTNLDPIREKRVALGQSEDVVAKKLGQPNTSMTTDRNGKMVSDWQYVTVDKAWYQAGDDDVGVWDQPSTSVDLSSTPQVDLLFIDGLLVAIRNHGQRTFTALDAALGDPVSDAIIQQWRSSRSSFGPAQDR